MRPWWALGLACRGICPLTARTAAEGFRRGCSKACPCTWPLHAVSRNLCALPVNICKAMWVTMWVLMGVPMPTQWSTGSFAVPSDVCMWPYIAVVVQVLGNLYYVYTWQKHFAWKHLHVRYNCWCYCQ